MPFRFPCAYDTYVKTSAHATLKSFPRHLPLPSSASWLHVATFPGSWQVHPATEKIPSRKFQQSQSTVAGRRVGWGGSNVEPSCRLNLLGDRLHHKLRIQKLPNTWASWKRRSRTISSNPSSLKNLWGKLTSLYMRALCVEGRVERHADSNFNSFSSCKVRLYTSQVFRYLLYAVFISLALASCWFWRRATPGNMGMLFEPPKNLLGVPFSANQSSKVNKCWTIACNDEEDLNYVWRFRCIDCWEGLNWSFMRLMHRCICKNWSDLFHIPWSRDLQICACKNLPSCQGRLLSSPPIRGTFAGKWEIVSARVGRRPVKTGNWPIQSFLLLAAAS